MRSVSAALRRLAIGAIATALPLVNAGAAGNGDVEFAFAVPDDGAVTLGIFDSSGKLVRQLHRLVPESNFRIGLNGLITRWDGRDENGMRLPAGNYYARGYLVGDVEVEGVDFHFNDWISATTDPLLTRVEDFLLLPDGDLILSGFLADGTGLVARYNADKGFLWHSTEPAPPLLAGDATRVFAAGPEVVTIRQAATGELLPLTITLTTRPSAIAADDASLFLASGTSLEVRTGPEMAPAVPRTLPEAFVSMDAASGTVAATAGKEIFLQKAGTTDFSPIKLDAPAASVALGSGNTIWFITNEGSDRIVGQVTAEGELLRTLRTEPDSPTPSRIRALREAETFAVLDNGQGIQRLRLLTRSPDGAWTIDWERSIRVAAGFGFSGQTPVAQEGTTLGEIPFRLEKNPLTGRHDTLLLHVVADPKGTRLETPDGLAIADISLHNDTVKTAAQRGTEPDSLRILRGNGAFVEEFVIRGLRHVVPLDAGVVELP